MMCVETRGTTPLAAAAYNLAVLLSRDRLTEAVYCCSKAFELSPNAKYAYTLPFTCGKKVIQTVRSRCCDRRLS